MKILVVGSLNIDHNYRVNNFLINGQTVDALSYHFNIGGKGINQAYASSQLVGTMFYGKANYEDIKNLLEQLPSNDNFNLQLVPSKLNSGNAAIILNQEGENQIIIAHGANYDFNDSDLAYIKTIINHYDALLLQEEINEDFLFKLIDLANREQKIICLNPAPYHPYTKELLNKVDIITPNETEFMALSGYRYSDTRLLDIQKLLNDKLKLIIITLGEKGAVAISKDGIYHQEAFKVKVMDTVGAGDTFNGYFLANYLLTNDLKLSLKLATKASSAAITKNGTLDAVPQPFELNFD